MILYYADNIERAKFWIEVSRNFSSEFDSLFITNELNVYLYLVAKGKKVIAIKEKGSKRLSRHDDNVVDIKRNYEVISGDTSIELAKKVVDITIQSCSRIDKTLVKYVFIWNGESLIAKTIFNEFKAFSKFRFFEISNFPGKVFVDSKGTNAQSKYFEDSSIVNKRLIDNEVEADFFNWKNKYLSTLQKPKQVKGKGGKLLLFSLLNESIKYFGYYILGFCKRADDSYINKVYRLYKFHNKKEIKSNYESSNISSEKINNYVFVPFQVSNDTQVLVNSKINNIDLILKAIEFSKNNNIQVVAKIHPAEENHEHIKQLYSICNLNGVILKNDCDSIELIKGAKVVFTINSTVGLQSKIMDKDVQIFGNAIYKYFNDIDMKVFITRYLINVDYFRPQGFNKAEIKKIIELDNIF
ncbi:hypothetical protein R7127_00635 [Vibrio sp. 1159]|uniref:capsular polysaccharide export protein, LipB/KpsS family n=1 Tax=Vibrio sp. 1159 TaxID=3074545 RepID=UPI002964A187|nr:hypothetical protein [Vibrio sp. 1159]MDW2318788.1 hypothetical protein [Vibrio sp. 1159]